MSRLDEIRERLDAATPGPWVRNDEEFYARICAKEYADIAHVGRANDSDFIAHAREDIPWLLGEVARLTAERDAAVRRAEAAEADLKSLSTYKPCQICKARDTCRAAWDTNGCVLFKWSGLEPGGEGTPQESRRMAPDIFTGEIG